MYQCPLRLNTWNLNAHISFLDIHTPPQLTKCHLSCRSSSVFRSSFHQAQHAQWKEWALSDLFAFLSVWLHYHEKNC